VQETPYTCKHIMYPMQTRPTQLLPVFLARSFLWNSSAAWYPRQGSARNVKSFLSVASMKPPVARREEDAVFLAGVAPEGWNKDLPRQSEGSKEALLDPAVPIPNPYGWMRDDKRETQEILDHLKAENDYTTEVTKHLAGLRDTLYEEMVASIQETDYTTPRPYGDWMYYTRTIKGRSYRIHCRAPRTSEKVQWDGTPTGQILPGEEKLLDVNELAKDKPYCSLGSFAISPSHRYAAYTADFKGDEVCNIYVKDLSGEGETRTVIQAVSGSVKWGADDDTLFYLKLDDAKRPYQAYMHKISTGEEALLFEENDGLFWMGISKSLDGKFLYVDVESKESSECHFLELADSSTALKCIAKRRHKVLYEAEHRNGKWWIQSNVGGLPNMALFTSPAVADCEDAWCLVNGPDGNPLFDGGHELSLDGLTCFKTSVVASGRHESLPRIWVINVDDTDNVASCERLSFQEDAYDVGVGVHYEFDASMVNVVYDSLVTPTQSLEVDMADTSNRSVLKEKVVPGYDRDLYGCERTTVPSRDGSVDIPVSIVYKKDVMEEHIQSRAPLHVHLYGYGSYGACMEADFSVTRLPLLHRGIVYVIAHIRGGSELGRTWYEEPAGAKYLCKQNTFNDFVDVGNWLTRDRKLTTPEKLSCEGRSAGGLLIGASINQAPELFKAAILGVPFVDVLCTMTDASIPLTIVEWEEWGNPSEVKYHSYMREYSPMENVKQGARYPSCLLTGGLHDPRVAYWEPAKFAATLRHAQSSNSGLVCLKMDLSAGHFSAR